MATRQIAYAKYLIREKKIEHGLIDADVFSVFSDVSSDNRYEYLAFEIDGQRFEIASDFLNAQKIYTLSPECVFAVAHSARAAIVKILFDYYGWLAQKIMEVDSAQNHIDVLKKNLDKLH